MPAASAPTVSASASVLDALAALLAYPDEGFPARAREAADALASEAPAVRARLDGFVVHVAASSETALAELFTRTFDWNPARSLEVGWHLYGEQYDRGAFLVHLRESLREAGVEEGTELPDYLPTVLRLLSRLPAADVPSFVSRSLLPALERLSKGFDDPQNPYAGVIRAVHEAVAPLAPDAGPNAGPDAAAGAKGGS